MMTTSSSTPGQEKCPFDFDPPPNKPPSTQQPAVPRSDEPTSPVENAHITSPTTAQPTEKKPNRPSVFQPTSKRTRATPLPSLLQSSQIQTQTPTAPLATAIANPRPDLSPGSDPPMQLTPECETKLASSPGISMIRASSLPERQPPASTIPNLQRNSLSTPLERSASQKTSSFILTNRNGIPNVSSQAPSVSVLGEGTKEKGVQALERVVVDVDALPVNRERKPHPLSLTRQRKMGLRSERPPVVNGPSSPRVPRRPSKAQAPPEVVSIEEDAPKKISTKRERSTDQVETAARKHSVQTPPDCIRSETVKTDFASTILQNVQQRHPVTDLFDDADDELSPPKSSISNGAPVRNSNENVRTRASQRAIAQEKNSLRTSSRAANGSCPSKAETINVDGSPAGPRPGLAKRPRLNDRELIDDDGVTEAQGQSKRDRVDRQAAQSQQNPEVRELELSEESEDEEEEEPVRFEELWLTYDMDSNEQEKKLKAILNEQRVIMNFYFMGLTDSEFLQSVQFRRIVSSRHVLLRKNRLRILPKRFFLKLSQMNVTKLDVSCNMLTTVAPEIRLCSKLKILVLEGNKLAEVPPELCSLKELVAIDLSANEISALPKGFGLLNNLQVLLLGANKLKALPNDFAKAGSVLHSIDVSKNSEICELPKCFEHLNKLVNLTVKGTELEKWLKEKDKKKNGNDLAKLIAGRSVEELKYRREEGAFRKEPPEVVEVPGD